MKQYLNNMYATQVIYHSWKLKISSTWVRSECPPQDHLFEELVQASGAAWGMSQEFQRSCPALWGVLRVFLPYLSRCFPRSTTTIVGGMVCSCFHKLKLSTQHTFPPWWTDCTPWNWESKYVSPSLRCPCQTFSHRDHKIYTIIQNFKMQFFWS